jgi:hypothetical protein
MRDAFPTDLSNGVLSLLPVSEAKPRKVEQTARIAILARGGMQSLGHGSAGGHEGYLDQ